MCLQMAILSEEDQPDNDEELCIVCWEEARQVVFYQCMHMVRSAISKLLMCQPDVCPWSLLPAKDKSYSKL